VGFEPLSIKCGFYYQLLKYTQINWIRLYLGVIDKDSIVNNYYLLWAWSSYEESNVKILSSWSLIWDIIPPQSCFLGSVICTPFSCNSNGDKSLKLIDDIITKNLDTFIKSIKFRQKFYNDIVQSYLDCIRK